jgi:hypothetical protein
MSGRYRESRQTKACASAVDPGDEADIGRDRELLREMQAVDLPLNDDVRLRLQRKRPRRFFKVRARQSAFDVLWPGIVPLDQV